MFLFPFFIFIFFLFFYLPFFSHSLHKYSNEGILWTKQHSKKLERIQRNVTFPIKFPSTIKVIIKQTSAFNLTAKTLEEIKWGRGREEGRCREIAVPSRPLCTLLPTLPLAGVLPRGETLAGGGRIDKKGVGGPSSPLPPYRVPGLESGPSISAQLFLYILVMRPR